jgi:murein DD-endopeptidase MepM/ murein hydrolase activator NlpD
VTRRHLTLMIIPHERGGGVRRVRVPYALLQATAAIAVLAALAAVLFFVGYGRLALTAAEAERLEAENERLRVVRAKVEDLARNLEASERAYRHIREMAGIRSPGRSAGRSAAGSPGSRGSPSEPRPLDEEERRLLALSTDAVPRLWPLTRKGFVTEEFNPRTGHTGIDIAVESNTPVLATADGVVVAAGRDSVYGNYVVLQHDPATTSLYAHTALNFVGDGELVRQGDIVAQSGNTGRSSAPHLHFEIRKNGVAVDPRTYLRR